MIILGINSNGIKEVLSLQVGENESAKYWLTVLNSLKNRGVRDIFILCADGLSGMREAVESAFPADRIPALPYTSGQEHYEICG